MAANDRDRQFHLLLSEEELEDLKEMARTYEMSASDLVRYLLHFQLERHGAGAKGERRDLILAHDGAVMKATLAKRDAERAALALRRGKR